MGQFELKLTSASTCTAWKGASFGTSLIVAVSWESEGIVARVEPRLMPVSRLNGGSFRSARAVVVNIELFAYQICGRCGFGAVSDGRIRERVKMNLQTTSARLSTLPATSPAALLDFTTTSSTIVPDDIYSPK